MGNNDQKYSSVEGELNENDCFTDRKTETTIAGQEGEIFLIDNANFGIRYEGGVRQLFPCNLPGALQKAGIKVVFSGAVKAIKLEELMAGQPFVLTKIREM
ncbi:MAG: hypothetical protein H7Z13_15225 [Ferruginibacter sp.]|nr:hypothetical protein [Ferruginibacter sp.]